jgi:WD40 repeat protein
MFSSTWELFLPYQDILALSTITTHTRLRRLLAHDCVQAKRTITSIKVHAGHVTCLHWLHRHIMSNSVAPQEDSVLVTGSSDGHIAVWKVDTAYGTAKFSLCARMDGAGNLNPTQVAPNTSNQGATPVTGLASVVNHDGELTSCLLASVASDGNIHIWECHDLSLDMALWTLKQQIHVLHDVIQNCVAFGRVPGHPEWCELCTWLPALCTIVDCMSICSDCQSWPQFTPMAHAAGLKAHRYHACMQ